MAVAADRRGEEGHALRLAGGADLLRRIDRDGRAVGDDLRDARTGQHAVGAGSRLAARLVVGEDDEHDVAAAEISRNGNELNAEQLGLPRRSVSEPEAGPRSNEPFGHTIDPPVAADPP